MTTYKCDMCNAEPCVSPGFYHDPHSCLNFVMCSNCYFSIPKHIPALQIVRYAARLIRGKDGSIQKEVVR
jgi:hypothetical protein